MLLLFVRYFTMWLSVSWIPDSHPECPYITWSCLEQVSWFTFSSKTDSETGIWVLVYWEVISRGWRCRNRDQKKKKIWRKSKRHYWVHHFCGQLILLQTFWEGEWHITKNCLTKELESWGICSPTLPHWLQGPSTLSSPEKNCRWREIRVFEGGSLWYIRELSTEAVNDLRVGWGHVHGPDLQQGRPASSKWKSLPNILAGHRGSTPARVFWEVMNRRSVPLLYPALGWSPCTRKGWVLDPKVWGDWREMVLTVD